MQRAFRTAKIRKIQKEKKKKKIMQNLRENPLVSGVACAAHKFSLVFFMA